jgi:hypothetical protein
MSKKKKVLQPSNDPVPVVYTTFTPLPAGQYWTPDYVSRVRMNKQIAASTNRDYSIHCVRGTTVVHVLKQGKLACISIPRTMYWVRNEEVDQVINFINEG